MGITCGPVGPGWAQRKRDGSRPTWRPGSYGFSEGCGDCDSPPPEAWHFCLLTCVFASKAEPILGTLFPRRLISGSGTFPRLLCRKEHSVEVLVGFLDLHRELAPPHGDWGLRVFSCRPPLSPVSSIELYGSQSPGSSLATRAGEAPHVQS